MKLRLGRRPDAEIGVGPPGPRVPTDTLTVAVTLPDALQGVRGARVELGYRNTYRYRWAGRRDAAMAFDDTAVATMGQVGTSYGSDRDATDWVAVLDTPLVVAGGVLEAGRHAVSVRLPSWAPGSSSLVAWTVRLVVERDGRDVTAEAPVTVLAPAPTPPSAEAPLVQGESALNDLLEFGLALERPCHRAGDEVRGVVSVTPRRAVTRPAKVGVRFRRTQLSHPLDRTPGDTVESDLRPTTTVAEDLTFVAGQTTEVPFAVRLPDDVDPTTEAVHASIAWSVVAEVTFAGLTGGIERAHRGIVVHTG